MSLANMDSWDAEPSDVGLVNNVSIIKNKWEGEDVEEDVVDSWDQEVEEEKEEIIKPETPPAKKKNSKKLGEKLEEKEKKKKQVVKEPEEEEVQLTREEILAEKLKRQKLQEESDLNIAKEVFGVLPSGIESKEDYDKLKEKVLQLVSEGVKNLNFVNFTEEIIHSLCLHLSSADLKKVHTWIGNLHIEKTKIEKGEKSKKSKGKGKAKLKLEGDNDYGEYSAFSADFEDFI
ncbi:eukaryotic translation initiation factor 3 subunit J-like [Cimex lectularius]|uniref:EIF3j n=1 Tax=Cimex lectularius TaxID=79782 RepID=A0A8I6S594_CIMLE|nr:eukaryotic translation initiation factor 3 subunit J-like [Cimex lectularius]